MHEQLPETLDMIGRRDHSVTNEYRIFGPPGTGKTRSATRHIHRAVDRFGSNWQRALPRQRPSSLPAETFRSI